jgi:hypothetical protein
LDKDDCTTDDKGSARFDEQTRQQDDRGQMTKTTQWRKSGPRDQESKDTIIESTIFFSFADVFFISFSQIDQPFTHPKKHMENAIAVLTTICILLRERNVLLLKKLSKYRH